jgi:hypothetical protein
MPFLRIAILFAFSVSLASEVSLWESAKSTIEFLDSGFDPDSALSGKQRHYFVASPKLCEIKDTIKIQVTIKEPDITLKVNKQPPWRDCEKYAYCVDCENNETCRYHIPLLFRKPGLDTLIYELLSKDNKSEFDTILIEIPIPFETIVMQKWNNVLFVNNNPQTNGGYEFTNFTWFKNNNKTGYLQFYSAGPRSRDTLNPNDIYKVLMQTANGIRISTCEGNAKINIVAQTTKSTLTKQVLGINEKSPNCGSKVYNLNGKLTKEAPAGVYIVEE